MKPAAAIALLLGFLIPLPVSAQTPITEQSGFLADLKAKTFQAVGEDKVPNYPTAWLPTARVAERWQWLVAEKP
jgi:hypothetical protein